MKKRNRSIIFWIGVILLVVPGLIHAYLLMPFPGSQELNAITVSYYLEKIVMPLRLIGAIFILWYLFKGFARNSTSGKLVKGTVLVLCLVSFYFTDVMFKAESMFEEPQTIKFANAIHNKVPESFIIIGVVNNGVAKAYPLVYLGYHHKVQDNVGNEPVLVTYCTMCRTGRVYSPIVNGKRQNFRLVGARHYNAIIEDQDTKTWWYQATGNAAVGKLKGNHLQELPYEQSTLSAWLEKHPGSLILQPDEHYLNDYNDLKNYDRLQAVDRDSTIKNKDTLIRKSWVLGVIVNGQPKAYDWRKLFKKRFINDQVNKRPLLVAIEDDSLTYHAFNSTVNGKALHFKLDTAGMLTDQETASIWDWDGLATSGYLKGCKLDKIQAYQEYWHSWKHFHPNTLFLKE
ncbi:uncharacterized protein DUF3179 [Mucilaginibacter frigoritolerans]|jgi:hypothetical protein|uniref:Uncharacterized protein DUF3179 n=1 Tax=Mucilaginibacter frigoritolerans TaxID=652788 RepID=A0A562U8J9_9SPHI|nr:DUF3179 domain-containing (seleno)protein [Mucilaginibacter frigoritolerans]TWJ01511.1 uncharacterized protein DUF3179 [Mucilaginibacter frigoritolerans]